MSGPGIATNIVHFGRLLRAAGLAIGSSAILDAVTAARIVGPRRRDDFHHALKAALICRHGDEALFDQAFDLFWRDPALQKHLMGLLLPDPPAEVRPPDEAAISRRLAEAMAAPAPPRHNDAEATLERDAAGTASAAEVLQERDFEDMSAAEIAEVRAAIARLHAALPTVATRRPVPASAGARLDMRASLRASLRHGGDIIALRRRKPRRRAPPLVVLCDISGSMQAYSRMMLHFMHGLSRHRQRVHCFLFGTRLTNISRPLRDRDVDAALEAVGKAAADWGGGTRIGDALRQFNRQWGRRVLGQGAVVLLITDGLERDDSLILGKEAARLKRSCRRLIWLNPLLRFSAFAPKAGGIRALLPHVDEFRSVHNLRSLAELTAALSGQAMSGADHLAPFRRQAA